MTQQGAALQGYNNELVKCIEDLSLQKEELNKQIQQAEEEKNKLQHQIQVLNEHSRTLLSVLKKEVGSLKSTPEMRSHVT
uniref:Sjoegren syndrome nuclear autoantigen 1 homolog n=1 Tax=Nothoprocta perdicaria TaxID=30464 RepID=A0A8C6Z3M9_NOTPE